MAACFWRFAFSWQLVPHSVVSQFASSLFFWVPKELEGYEEVKAPQRQLLR